MAKIVRWPAAKMDSLRGYSARRGRAARRKLGGGGRDLRRIRAFNARGSY